MDNDISNDFFNKIFVKIFVVCKGLNAYPQFLFNLLVNNK